MRENCTYGSMRGRTYPAGASRSTLHPLPPPDTSDLTAEALFGAKLLQPTKIVRIVSETPSPAPTGETGETGPTA